MTPGAAWSTHGQRCGENPLAMPGDGGTLPERQVPGGCGGRRTCPCRKLDGPRAGRGLGGSWVSHAWDSHQGGASCHHTAGRFYLDPGLEIFFYFLDNLKSLKYNSFKLKKKKVCSHHYNVLKENPLRSAFWGGIHPKIQFAPHP